jgi:hypothetical protein
MIERAAARASESLADALLPNAKLVPIYGVNFALGWI